jgi:hypothetical protein
MCVCVNVIIVCIIADLIIRSFWECSVTMVLSLVVTMVCPGWI